MRRSHNSLGVLGLKFCQRTSLGEVRELSDSLSQYVWFLPSGTTSPSLSGLPLSWPLPLSVSNPSPWLPSLSQARASAFVHLLSTLLKDIPIGIHGNQGLLNIFSLSPFLRPSLFSSDHLFHYITTVVTTYFASKTLGMRFQVSWTVIHQREYFSGPLVVSLVEACFLWKSGPLIPQNSDLWEREAQIYSSGSPRVIGSKAVNIFLPLGFWTHKFYLMWTYHHMMVVD